jgi:hypothetical protein
VRLPPLPGAAVDFGRHSLRRFVDVEGAQQATVLAAQAFTSLIPFLVVASAFGPDESDIADRINDRFDIHGSAARSVEALFNDAGEGQRRHPRVVGDVIHARAPEDVPARIRD